MSPDLQQLAQVMLKMVEPVVQGGMAYLSAAESGAPGSCAQVWCPVCAVAAVASGEQHPLTAIVAEYGVALLALVRAVAEPDDPAPPDGDRKTPHEEQPTPGPGRYESIVVTIHE